MGILKKKKSNTVYHVLFLFRQQACKHSLEDTKPLSVFCLFKRDINWNRGYVQKNQVDTI